MSERLRRLGPALALLFLVPSPALAKTQITWNETEPLSGEVVDGELFLEVSGPGTYSLLVLDDPEVHPPRFSVDGTIRYDDVEGVAYLEMWTVLEDGSRYFTRTLAETGPLAAMTGSSSDRAISLPFELGADGPTPASLEINLVTEGPGRFWVGTLVVKASGTGSEETTTTVESESRTHGADSVATTTPASLPPATAGSDVEGDQGAAGTLWWGGAGLLAVAGVVVWLERSRRRRRAEQRRMSAIDSVGC